MTNAIGKLDRRLANVTYVMQCYMKFKQLPFDIPAGGSHDHGVMRISREGNGLVYIDSAKMGMDQLLLGH